MANLVPIPEATIKVLDFILQSLVKKWRDRKNISKEFESLKRKISYVNVINDFPAELHKLRLFFIENGLVEKPENREFFEKWLTDPLVARGIPAANAIPKENIPKLIEELNEVRL